MTGQGRKADEKVIVTCAVTGGDPFNRKHPSFPVTPKQICNAAIEAAKAGASIVHLHVRDPQTGEGTRRPELFRELVARVRDAGINVVINLTAGGGANFYPDPSDPARAAPGTDMATAEERLVHVAEALPEMCTLDVTVLSQAFGEDEFVYMNTQHCLRGMARMTRDMGVKPELEVFNPGDVLFARQMVSEGLITGRPLFQFVLGVKWGAPADPETMLYMRNLLPENAVWAGFGIARMQMPMVAQAALLGGNVRVGLEDNLYLSRGVFATNGQLVERAVTILDSMGYSVASPDEARQILGLKSPVK